jgi:hypothetical protein
METTPTPPLAEHLRIEMKKKIKEKRVKKMK